MITRDVGQVRSVAAFAAASYDASCGSLNGDSTGNLVTGFIIDRLGLGRGYSSVLVEAHADADIGTSTVDTKAGFISAWLYHSSTTCAADFDLLSTQSINPRQPLFVFQGPSATSTLASGYTATSTTAGTFGTFSATATGFARGSYSAPYSLAPAGRYLQVALLPEAYASSSGGTRMRVTASLVFGEPDNVDLFPSTSTGQGPAGTSSVPTVPWRS